jgi:hypothetical protein
MSLPEGYVALPNHADRDLREHAEQVQRNFEKIDRALRELALVDFIGSGDPNGVVTASPGATYRNRAGGAGTGLYVKESGVATNTGWVGK